MILLLKGVFAKYENGVMLDPNLIQGLILLPPGILQISLRETPSGLISILQGTSLIKLNKKDFGIKSNLH